MINDSNVNQEIIQSKRPASVGPSSFTSSLSYHLPEEDRRYLMTTNQQFYGKPPKEDPITFIEKNENKFKNMAGTTTKSVEDHGIKTTSVLTGEKFRDDPDPQLNTKMQRSWIPSMPADLK